MKAAFPVSALMLGVLLLLASFGWSTLFPATRTWTTEKSQRLSELGGEANRLQFAIVNAQQNPSMHFGQNPAELQAAYDEVRDEYDRLHAEFENARQRPETAARLLRWSGIVCVGAAAAGLWVMQQNS